MANCTVVFVSVKIEESSSKMVVCTHISIVKLMLYINEKIDPLCYLTLGEKF